MRTHLRQHLRGLIAAAGLIVLLSVVGVPAGTISGTFAAGTACGCEVKEGSIEGVQVKELEANEVEGEIQNGLGFEIETTGVLPFPGKGNITSEGSCKIGAHLKPLQRCTFLQEKPFGAKVDWKKV